MRNTCRVEFGAPVGAVSELLAQRFCCHPSDYGSPGTTNWSKCPTPQCPGTTNWPECPIPQCPGTINWSECWVLPKSPPSRYSLKMKLIISYGVLIELMWAHLGERSSPLSGEVYWDSFCPVCDYYSESGCGFGSCGLVVLCRSISLSWLELCLIHRNFIFKFVFFLCSLLYDRWRTHCLQNRLPFSSLWPDVTVFL